MIGAVVNSQILGNKVDALEAQTSEPRMTIAKENQYSTEV